MPSSPVSGCFQIVQPGFLFLFPTLVGLLGSMTATAAVKCVVYGIGLPGARLEHVAALDTQKCKAVPGDGEIDVVAAVGSVCIGR